jgi:hypothetical protein
MVFSRECLGRLEIAVARQMKPAANNLYQEDFCVWSRHQAEFLRERRFDELDLANLIEKVED